MEDDLEQQVAELARRAPASRRPRARRRPRTPPRAGGCAATRGSARGPTGSRRAARSRALIQGMPHGEAMSATGRDRREVQRPAEVRRASAPRPSSRPDARTGRRDGRAGYSRAQDGERVAAVAARGGRAAARPRRHRAASRAGARPARAAAGRDGSIGRRDEPLRHDDRQPGRRIQPPPEAGLGEERVQHRPAAPGRRDVAPAIAGSRVMSASAFCFEYQIENAEFSSAAFCSASGSRVSSSATRYR